VVCLAPRAREEIVRPRRLAGVGARPLNFTLRTSPLCQQSVSFWFVSLQSFG
jgi:hypothetical protein